MFGPDIFRLNLYAQNNTGNAYGKAILQKQSNKGDRWILGHVFVENRQNEDIRFVIEAFVKILKKFIPPFTKYNFKMYLKYYLGWKWSLR